MDLIRAGLQDLDKARALFDQLKADDIPDERCAELLSALAHACDPDMALSNFVDIVNAMQSSQRDLEHVIPDNDALKRLVTVLGVSDAMGKFMRFKPQLVEAAAVDNCNSHLFNHAQRRARLLKAVGADPDEPAMPVASKDLAEAATALRSSYRNQLAAIIAQDAVADDPTSIQPTISRELSDLADAALEGALAIARHETEGSEHVRFTIIGMGKLGAQELNYVSDVDLIYVVEPADKDVDHQTLIRVGTKMGTMLQRVCQSAIMGVAEQPLWQIDGGLRPEGKDGALVRVLSSHKNYYEQWAENWEFQALLKARPVAGDPDLGQAYMDMTRPFVWSASKRKNFVYDCQKMRKRVEDLIPAPLKDREIKLGRGGLRDVEFTVQMLQLVHGRTDESLRTSNTLDSLQRLSEGGYVSRKQAVRMSQDYRFERVMQHRQQIWSLKRTHLFPDLGRASVGGLEKKRDIDVDELNQNQELRRLARAFGPPRSTPPAPRHLLSPDAAGQRPDGERPDRPERRGSTGTIRIHRFRRPGRRHPPRAGAHRRRGARGQNQPHHSARRLAVAGRGPEPGHGPAQLAQTGGELRHRIRLPRLPARLHLRRPAPVPHPVQLTIPRRRAQQVGRIDQLAWRRRQSAGPHARGLGRADRLGSGAPCAATKSNASACLG